jgi:hypothetical protein
MHLSSAMNINRSSITAINQPITQAVLVHNFVPINPNRQLTGSQKVTSGSLNPKLINHLLAS